MRRYTPPARRATPARDPITMPAMAPPDSPEGDRDQTDCSCVRLTGESEHGYDTDKDGKQTAKKIIRY